MQVIYQLNIKWAILCNKYTIDMTLKKFNFPYRNINAQGIWCNENGSYS